MLLQFFDRLIKIVHVHADAASVLCHFVRLRDVHMEAIGILHAEICRILTVDVLLRVRALEPQRFKQLDQGLGVLRKDQRVKGCDFYLFFPP